MRSSERDTILTIGPRLKATRRGPSDVQYDATGTYGEWQEYTAAGKDLKVSYKMGDLEFTPAAEKLSGVRFNTYSGPFLLEIEVTAGGRRKTVRSPEFTREPPHLMVT